MPEKGTCLASCRGELRAVPSGGMHRNSEVLELLLFGERNRIPLMLSGVPLEIKFPNKFTCSGFIKAFDNL